MAESATLDTFVVDSTIDKNTATKGFSVADQAACPEFLHDVQVSDEDGNLVETYFAPDAVISSQVEWQQKSSMPSIVAGWGQINWGQVKWSQWL